MSRFIPVSPGGHHSSSPKYREMRGKTGIRKETTLPQTNHQDPCTRSVLHKTGKPRKHPLFFTILVLRSSSVSLTSGASLWVVDLLKIEASSSEGIGGISLEFCLLIVELAIGLSVSVSILSLLLSLCITISSYWHQSILMSLAPEKRRSRTVWPL